MDPDDEFFYIILFVAAFLSFGISWLICMEI